MRTSVTLVSSQGPSLSLVIVTSFSFVIVSAECGENYYGREADSWGVISGCLILGVSILPPVAYLWTLSLRSEATSNSQILSVTNGTRWFSTSECSRLSFEMLLVLTFDLWRLEALSEVLFARALEGPKHWNISGTSGQVDLLACASCALGKL